MSASIIEQGSEIQTMNPAMVLPDPIALSTMSMPLSPNMNQMTGITVAVEYPMIDDSQLPLFLVHSRPIEFNPAVHAVTVVTRPNDAIDPIRMQGRALCAERLSQRAIFAGSQRPPAVSIVNKRFFKYYQALQAQVVNTVGNSDLTFNLSASTSLAGKIRILSYSNVVFSIPFAGYRPENLQCYFGPYKVQDEKTWVKSSTDWVQCPWVPSRPIFKTALQMDGYTTLDVSINRTAATQFTAPIPPLYNNHHFYWRKLMTMWDMFPEKLSQDDIGSYNQYYSAIRYLNTMLEAFPQSGYAIYLEGNADSGHIDKGVFTIHIDESTDNVKFEGSTLRLTPFINRKETGEDLFRGFNSKPPFLYGLPYLEVSKDYTPVPV
jgi:hypothetical protein